MARLLRLSSFPRLRCSPSPSSPIRYLRSLDHTVLLQTAQRSFAGSAVVEESSNVSQTSSEIAGSAIEDGSVKRDAKVQNENGRLRQNTPASRVQSSMTTEKSSPESSDNLSSLILNKMRGKPSTATGQDDNTKTESNASNPEGKSIDDNKWAQVMSSIRKIAAKNRAAGSTGKSDATKMREGENGDDFADLDLPQSGSDATLIRNQSRTSIDNSFKKDFPPNVKHQKGFQAGNMQRPKDMKLGNFNFLKSRDSSGPSARTDVSADSSLDHSFGSTKDIPFSARSKENWNQQANKEVKPTSFEFLKVSETKTANIREDRTVVNTSEQAQPGRDNVIPYSGYTVCIQDVPTHCNLGVVKYMLSTHGEVVSVFRKPGSSGSCSVYVEFKTAEAMDNALSVRQLPLEGRLLNIVRADLPITTVVRLSRVSKDTPENHIRTICEKYGNLDSIRRRGNGVYDIFYRVKELPNIPNILESLNEVTMNQRRWIALPAPTLHPAIRKDVLRTSEGKAWHASQLQQMLNKIEMGLDTMAICFEDLKALTHMEDSLK